MRTDQKLTLTVVIVVVIAAAIVRAPVNIPIPPIHLPTIGLSVIATPRLLPLYLVECDVYYESQPQSI